MNPPIHLAANVARVELVYNYAESMVENVYHVEDTAGWTRSKLVTLVGKFANWESIDAKILRNIDVTLDHITATDISSDSGAFYQENEGIVGTRGGEPLPPSVTFSVKASTGMHGRSYRGRTFWVGISGDMLSANPNTLLSASAVSIVGALNALILAVNAGTQSIAVVSFRHNNDWRLTAVTTPVLEYVNTDLFVDNQRRRLLGHNRHR